MTEAYEVLIVDDEEIVCRGLAQFVKWEVHGFHVAGTAYGVDEALQFLEHTPVDVAFIDIRMPKKTGIDLLEALKKDYPETRAVILSGFSEFSYAREALRLGAVDYLTKPVNLKEVEELLDRLKADFERERWDRKVRSSRIEGLLLSAARGYGDLEPARYALPALMSWCGLAAVLLDRELSEEETAGRKEVLKGMIEAVLPDAFILNNEVFGLFAILPFKAEEEAEDFIHFLEQSGEVHDSWACGVSRFKQGLSELREGYQEAQQALRYHRASQKAGIIWYRNIESLFSQKQPEVEEIIASLYSGLANPEERGEAMEKLEEALQKTGEDEMDFTRAQTVCIRCLIELAGLMQGLKLKEKDLHGRLNHTLEKILLCSDIKGVEDSVREYFNWLAEKMEESDDQQLGKGVIREIQLFIRRHYNEELSLNMLAEEFFLHPNYLSRLFKEKTGENFVEYLTRVRMEKVMELLDTTEDKVGDICATAGYDNPRYFSKVFKQYTGMTPTEYRERNLK